MIVMVNPAFAEYVLNPADKLVGQTLDLDLEQSVDSSGEPIGKVIAELEQSYARSKSPSLPKIETSDEDEDDALSYFQRLAED